MRAFITAIAAALIGVQCGVPGNKSEAQPQQEIHEPVPAPQAPVRSSLSADTLRAGGQITLRLGRPHPQGLAITDPDDRYFYLQSGTEARLMDSAAFARLQETPISAAMTGLFYDDGKPVTRRVFTKAGKYTVYLADDLETEPENTNAESLEFWYSGK